MQIFPPWVIFFTGGYEYVPQGGFIFMWGEKQFIIEKTIEMSAWQFVTIHWGGDKFTPRLKIHTPLGTNSTPRAHAFISTLLILYLGKISHGANEFFHDPC